MSKRQIEECVRDTLQRYFDDLRGAEPSAVHEMIMNAVEKPLLEVVMLQAQGNQTRAAELLGMNRNTLRKKLQQHGID